MSTFIKEPNLPRGRVSALICGGLNEELIDFFEGKGTEIYYTEKNNSSDKAVSKHADLSAFYLGKGRIIVDKSQKRLISELSAAGLDVAETYGRVGGAYPGDCILNHTVIGDRLIGNSKIFDKSVEAELAGFKLIHTNQGYCKCSVLVVDERSIITDDESIARNSSENGIDCLLIRKGDVYLKGHDYGFIGGASGKISKDEIIFFGDITQHRDYERIKQFIADRKMKTVSFAFPLTDFGGIIPIKENIF